MDFTYFVDNRSVNGKSEAPVRGKKAKGPHDKKECPSSEKICAVSKLICEDQWVKNIKQ